MTDYYTYGVRRKAPLAPRDTEQRAYQRGYEEGTRGGLWRAMCVLTLVWWLNPHPTKPRNMQLFRRLLKSEGWSFRYFGWCDPVTGLLHTAQDAANIQARRCALQQNPEE